MTIFQKMLAVPVLALFLYSGFLFYSYQQYLQTTDKVNKIREQYLPVLEMVNDNTYLFNQIRSNFKDAVLADEPSWLPNTKEYKEKIEHNFTQLAQHPNLVDGQALDELQQSFLLYYQNASQLARSIINDQESLTIEENLVENVEQFHNAANKQFTQLKQSIKQSFRQTLNDTNQVLNQLLLVGGVMSIFIMLIILTVTLAVSLSTRHNFNQLIERMKSFALGSTDFSRRLQRKNRDELSYLIYWFNKLSDKLEQDYKLLESVSITDKLTQLNNRNRTDSYLPQALQDAKHNQDPIAVIILDIDHFKRINDTFGHLTGDKVLQAFAGILKKHAHEHDFLARWGGEEFILVVPKTTPDKARIHADHIRQTIAAHEFADVGHITASFGVAISQPNDQVPTIIKRADECLYQAKHQGRNRVVIAN